MGDKGTTGRTRSGAAAGLVVRAVARAAARVVVGARGGGATPAQGKRNGMGDGATGRTRSGAAAGLVVGALVGAAVGVGVGAGDGGAARALVEMPLVNMAQFLPWICTVQKL
jgi:hypothetical protein